MAASPEFSAPQLPSTSISLWDGPAPHSLGSAEKDTPQIYAYLPESAARPTRAMVIFPGGGYQGLAFIHEGIHEAEWLQKRGIAAFVVFYRLPGNGYRHPVPLLDAQRAVRLVRDSAAEWNINPAQVAVMGFSAGGHLASTLITHFDAGDANAADPVDRQSCRPNFSALVYAVVSFKDGVAHPGSMQNLLGPDPDPALVENLSNETQVTPQTPPTVLVHAVNDGPVPIENSRLMLAALQKAGVPGELHEYPTGGHGFGFGPKQVNAPAGWLERAYEWLQGQGFHS
jgi:acetyl esterase/lipase